MLDDSRLKIFLTLAGKGSFTKAAEELGITQPAVSQNISELEKHAGTKLFDRQRGYVTLTPAGCIFKAYAEAIDRLYTEVSSIFAPLEARTVNVCASEDIYEYVTGDLLKDFFAVHPEITFIRSAADEADLTVSPQPVPEKRGIIALSYNPSQSLKDSDLWKIMSRCLYQI